MLKYDKMHTEHEKRNRKMKRKKIVKAVICVLPLIAGVCGLWAVDGDRFTDALYHSLEMYALDFTGKADNFLVELARWTAPLVTAGWVVTAFASLRGWWQGKMAGLRSDSVAVYGGGEEKTSFLRALGKRGVSGGSRLISAGRYVLLGSDEENFAFCREHRDALEGKPVSLKCDFARAQTVRGANLKAFSPEENGARLFWKQSGLYRDAEQAGGELKIVLTGFGRLGEELLYWGLQDNLFSPEQEIEYHVFGGGERFAALHPGLSALSDRVIFHGEQWFESIPLLKSANRILVCGENAAADARDILFAVPEKTLDVFGGAGTSSGFLEEESRIRLFDWEREAMKPEIVLDDLLLERAKRINLRYAVLYGGAADTAEEKEKQWAALDAFTRYSNISSADYHEIRLQILNAQGISPDPDKLPADTLELLSELEHIRWCRYHLLNNWTRGVPENGKAKDRAKRIHRDLIPYAELTEGEKEKDRENIRVLLSVGE